jgi:tRNA 2-thiouridine synthesizing protein A
MDILGQLSEAFLASHELLFVSFAGDEVPHLFSKLTHDVQQPRIAFQRASREHLHDTADLIAHHHREREGGVQSEWSRESQARKVLRQTQVLDPDRLLGGTDLAGKALQKLSAGEVLKLVCTDPGSLEDIPALARQRHHTLVHQESDGGEHSFWVRK